MWILSGWMSGCAGNVLPENHRTLVMSLCLLLSTWLLWDIYHQRYPQTFPFAFQLLVCQVQSISRVSFLWPCAVISSEAYQGRWLFYGPSIVVHVFEDKLHSGRSKSPWHHPRLLTWVLLIPSV